MAEDKTPVLAPPLSLETHPPDGASGIFRRRPKNLKQLGLATSYQPVDDGFIYSSKPSYYQLSAWDQARRKEPIIKQSIDYIVLAVLSKIGPYSHPSPMIDKFVQANLNHIQYKKCLSDLLNSILWSGFGASEIVWDYRKTDKDPQVWIGDIVNFHPLQVNLVLNDYGMVKDGDPSPNSSLRSGVWVPCPTVLSKNSSKPSIGPDYQGSMIRLKRNKRIYIAFGGEGNNPYGRSQLESVLPYHLFKEAYRDMLTTALDRYGTPLMYIIVPPQDTKERIEEEDGSFRFKTMHEQTVEQIENISSQAALVFTQTSKDQPINLGSLTTSNNFSDSFTKAINFCDENMLTGMGIPNLLFKDGGRNLGSGGASETQLEVFNSFISAIYDLLVIPFTQQCILPLIQYNFNIDLYPEALDPGQFVKKPSRSTELKTVVESIKMLTELGYSNPTNPLDFQYVRELVGLPDRDFNRSDFKQVIPSKKTENTTERIISSEPSV